MLAPAACQGRPCGGGRFADVCGVAVQALEESLEAEYEGIAIVDEEENVLGTMPMVTSAEAARMGPGEVHDYMTRLAGAAGMKEEFQQMIDDAIVRCPLPAVCAAVCTRLFKTGPCMLHMRSARADCEGRRGGHSVILHPSVSGPALWVCRVR